MEPVEITYTAAITSGVIQLYAAELEEIENMMTEKPNEDREYSHSELYEDLRNFIVNYDELENEDIHKQKVSALLFVKIIENISDIHDPKNVSLDTSGSHFVFEYQVDVYMPPSGNWISTPELVTKTYRVRPFYDDEEYFIVVHNEEGNTVMKPAIMTENLELENVVDFINNCLKY